MKIKRMKRSHLIALLLTIVIFTTTFSILSSVVGCTKVKKTETYINDISFSPDSKKILFDHRRGEEPRMIHVHDLETGELSAYQAPLGEVWGTARYSFDGKKIVFIITPFINGKYDPSNSQIAIMEPDGKKIRKITSTPGFKIYPSFSHSGKKIIFCKAGRIRESGHNPAVDYDVYEVDIDTGKEKSLTWFKFFMISSPYYFPGDERIIFSAYGPPGMYPGIRDDDYKSIQKKQEEHTAKDKMKKRLGYSDDIYIVQKGARHLPNPYIESVESTRLPLIVRDGSHVYFSSQAYKADGKGDGDQIFEYEKNGKHRRITNIKPASIWSAAISHDGKLLAIVYQSEENRKIVIYNVQNSSSREIGLPNNPVRIINPIQ